MVRLGIVGFVLFQSFLSIAHAQDGLLDVHLDYVFWETNGTKLPSLLTTSPEGTPQNLAGVLPDSTTLFGNSEYFDSLRHGGRVNLTRWFDKSRSTGIDFAYFGGRASQDGDSTAFSDGSTILARPYFNTQTNSEEAQLISYTDPSSLPIVAGSIAVSSSSEFHSGEALFRKSNSNDKGRLDFLVGYRFFRYREGMAITESLESTNPTGLIQVGTLLDLYDRFSCESNFHGCQVGFAWTREIDCLSLQAIPKLAIGNVRKLVKVDGGTSVSVPSGGDSFNTGGLLALPSNIGTFSENDFAFLPEIGLNARVKLLEKLDFSMGYTALCLTNVARLGGSIDRNVDGSQITSLETPGAPVTSSPRTGISDATFFAHGISVGLGFYR